MVWKSSRVTTSKVMERRSGARVCPATSQESRLETAKFRATASPRGSGCAPPMASEPWSTEPRGHRWPRSAACHRARARRSARPHPVAAAASTVISPKVSQARMSTRVTLTMFLPAPPV